MNWDTTSRQCVAIAVLLSGCATPQKSTELIPNYSACISNGTVDERCASHIDAAFAIHREYKIRLLQEYNDAFRTK